MSNYNEVDQIRIALAALFMHARISSVTDAHEAPNATRSENVRESLADADALLVALQVPIR